MLKEPWDCISSSSLCMDMGIIVKTNGQVMRRTTHYLLDHLKEDICIHNV